jgi:hypothetical protein
MKDRVDRLIAAIEGECDGLAVDRHHATAILQYVDGAAQPSAGAVPVAHMVAIDDGLGTVFLEFIGDRPPAGTKLYTLAASPTEASPEADKRDAERLDWLDATNKRFRMGWYCGIAPAGNVSLTTVIMGGKPIRQAIDSALSAAEKKGGE